MPEGRSEDDNREERRVGEPPRFDFEPKDHTDLGVALGGIDFELASKLAGSRFVTLHGALARLHRALIQFMLDVHTREHGYREIYVPYLVTSEVLRGTGQLPKFADDQFRVEGSDLYMIPTAEVPVTNVARGADPRCRGAAVALHMPHSLLPPRGGLLRQGHPGGCCASTSSRRSSWCTSSVRRTPIGRWRPSPPTPSRSSPGSGSPTGLVTLCTGDIGFAAAKTYDIEVWLPGQRRYREISSCSNCEAFQARRMRARWRNPETGKTELVHTLNGSGVAIGRALIAIMENFQQADGSIRVPEPLVPYMGGMAVIRGGE